MKKNKYLFGCLLLFFMVLSLVGCEPVTDDGSYVDPITLYEKIGGNWKLSDVKQIDETAKAMGISPDEMNLTEQFNFQSFVIALNVSEDKNPTSYQVSGLAPELFPNSGFWDLDSHFPYADGTAPTVNLYSDEAKTKLTGQLSIVSLPGAKQEMELKLTRTSEGVPFVSYQYKLVTP
jgi:hypothetical protein